MLKAVVGHSNDPDSLVALEEALEQCQTALGGDIPQAAILFAALDFDHGLILQQINQVFPGIQLIGGTTDGEMSSVLEFQQDSLVLMLLCSDEVEFYAIAGRNVSRDPIAIAQQTAIAAKQKAITPKLCLTVAESLTTSGVAILEGLKQGLGPEIPVVGGTTCDEWQFKRTYQFCGTEVLSDSVPILLLGGNLLFSHGVASGWIPIGKRGIATKVEANVLHEVDGQPTLEFYRDYLGDTRPSPEYRLAVFEPNSDHWYMRSSNGHYDEVTGSIAFFADIPDEAEIQVVRANRDEIVASTQTSVRTAIANYPGVEPAVALFFSCTGRLKVLGTRTKEEYEIARSLLNIPACGFYTYGEIAPLQVGGPSQFHNETFVTLILGTK